MCEPVGVSAASLDAPRGEDAHPPPRTPLLPRRRASGTPRAVKQAARQRGPVCPHSDSLQLWCSGLRQGRRAWGTRPSRGWEAARAASQSPRAPPGGRAQVGPRTLPSSISANPHAPRGRRRSPDLYFLLIRSWSSLLHLNEELRASGRSEAGAMGVTREHPPRS